jgi:exopolysaccharide production protein ExoQ
VVLKFADNPFFGSGFESFWLGKRFQDIRSILGGLNQCHNGYLEIYVNLGFVGLALLAAVMVTGYRNVIAALRHDPEVGPLRLAYFVVGVIYNFTEAGMKMMSPVWIFFLLSIMALPKVSRKTSEVLSARQTAPSDWMPIVPDAY